MATSYRVSWRVRAERPEPGLRDALARRLGEAAEVGAENDGVRVTFVVSADDSSTAQLGTRSEIERALQDAGLGDADVTVDEPDVRAST